MSCRCDSELLRYIGLIACLFSSGIGFSYALIHWSFMQFADRTFKDSMTWCDCFSALLIVFALLTMICLSCCSMLSQMIFCMQRLILIQSDDINQSTDATALL